MQLNMTTDYAVRLLLYLATVDRMAISQEIAEKMNIPPKYTTTIAAKLKEKGYIQSLQGSNGGYALIKKPEEITLKDIVETMEGAVVLNRCTHCDPDCFLYCGKACPISDAYGLVQTNMESAMEAITLSDLVETNRHSVIEPNDRDGG